MKKILFQLSFILLFSWVFCYNILFASSQNSWFTKEQLLEINYFSRFTELASPKIDYSIETKTCAPCEGLSEGHPLRKTCASCEDTPDEILHRTILSLLSEIYTRSSDKWKTLNTLSQLLLSCRKNGKTESIRNVCRHFSAYVVGQEVKTSKITFSDLRKTFQKEKSWISRTIERSDLDESFFPLNHPYWGIDIKDWMEYWIGNYLFWIAISSDYFSEDSGLIYNGLRILKAWDTHWQEFAKLTFTDPQNYGSKKELKLINHKLNYYIWTFTKEPWILLISQYELQKNGDWKLKSCKEELSYNDWSVKTKAPNLDSCNRVEITLETTLGQ